MSEKLRVTARPTFLRREPGVLVSDRVFHSEAGSSLSASIAERNFLHPEFCPFAEAHFVFGVEDAT